MGVAFVLDWNGNVAFDGTTTLMPIPAGIVLGQLLLVQFNYFNTQATAPSIAGWSQLAPPSDVPQFYAFYKVADATDQANAGTGSWTVTESDGFVVNWGGVAYSGNDQVTPFSAGPTPTGDSSDAFTDYSGAPLTGGTNVIYVMLLTFEANAGADPVTSQPVGMTLRSRGLNLFGTGDCLIYDQTISGASGTPTGTHAPGTWGSVTLIIRAASAPGGDIAVGPTWYVTA